VTDIIGVVPRYLPQKAAAAYLGVSVRYFRDHVDVKPKTYPGRGKKPVLRWSTLDLDAWTERVSDPKSRAGRRSA
jgi:hypothetical protein